MRKLSYIIPILMLTAPGFAQEDEEHDFCIPEEECKDVTERVPQPCYYYYYYDDDAYYDENAVWPSKRTDSFYDSLTSPY